MSDGSAPAVISPRIRKQVNGANRLAPTLLGLLNLHHSSKFYGYDILKLEAGRERLFMGTYQNVAYVRGNKMVVLSRQQKIAMFAVDFTNGTETTIPLETAASR